MALSFKEVAEILKLIDGSDCDEVVLELEGTKLVVRRRGNERDASVRDLAELPLPASGPSAKEDNGPVAKEAPANENVPDLQLVTPSEADAEPEPAAEEGLVALRAPMVGTFYRRPAPDDPAFVEVGTPVKAGDPLCLIEVMKLYTTIEAPEDGVVERIAVEDGTLVEFNALLFLIRPE